jgi:hypothetical protein
MTYNQHALNQTPTGTFQEKGMVPIALDQAQDLAAELVSIAKQLAARLEPIRHTSTPVSGTLPTVPASSCQIGESLLQIQDNLREARAVLLRVNETLEL